jgi:hypothetical protein
VQSDRWGQLLLGLLSRTGESRVGNVTGRSERSVAANTATAHARRGGHGAATHGLSVRSLGSFMHVGVVVGVDVGLVLVLVLALRIGFAVVKVFLVERADTVGTLFGVVIGVVRRKRTKTHDRHTAGVSSGGVQILLSMTLLLSGRRYRSDVSRRCRSAHVLGRRRGSNVEDIRVGHGELWRSRLVARGGRCSE